MKRIELTRRDLIKYAGISSIVISSWGISSCAEDEDPILLLNMALLVGTQLSQVSFSGREYPVQTLETFTTMNN